MKLVPETQPASASAVARLTAVDRKLGQFDVPGFPLRFSDFPGELDLVAPFMGEHNVEILGGLGYATAQIEADCQRYSQAGRELI